MAIPKDISPDEFMRYIKQWYLERSDMFMQKYQQEFITSILDIQRAERLRQLEKQEQHAKNYGFRGLSLNFHGVEGRRLTAFKNNWDIGKEDSKAVYYTGHHGQYFIVDDLDDDDHDTHAEWRDLNEDFKPK